jgi:hypothetical protein
LTPRIFYTDGFITDYSYVFTRHAAPGRRRKDGSRSLREKNWVSVWHWKRLIFDGTAERFLAFCRRRVKPAILPPDQQAFSAAGDALKRAFS